MLREVPDTDKVAGLLNELKTFVNMHVFQLIGDKVFNGPFTGMQVPEQTHWYDGNEGCKVLGTYEFELHETIERAISRQPKRLFNIGCAEGYYAIGFARRLPNLKVIAVDKDHNSLNQCMEYAKKNNVSHQICTAPEFDESLYLPGLYFIDIEGAELKFLLPHHPALEESDIIVECHDYEREEIRNAFKAKFKPTHEIDVIETKLFDYLKLAEKVILLPPIMHVLATTENRPFGGCWLAMWKK